MQSREHAATVPAWFQHKYPKAALTCAAYFSMEFMLSESLPIYSGGLGNVAGDQLKAASDLGVPVIGVGLLYQQGYFRQVIDKDGAQQALYPYNDPDQLPITPVRRPNGELLRLEIDLPGYSVWLRAWQAQVGRVTAVPPGQQRRGKHARPARDHEPTVWRGAGAAAPAGNPPWNRGLAVACRTRNPAGSLPPERRACGLRRPGARSRLHGRVGSILRSALAVTRAGNIFTTHTAVPAGFDRFPPALIEPYFAKYVEKKLGLTVHDFMALGRQDPNDSSESFNMAYLAIRGSGAVNGVSRLHGKVSRHLFGPLFPHWPEDEVPIGHVTNGVHMPSWDSAEADDLWTEACGKDRWLGEMETLERDIRRISDARLWKFRSAASTSLVEYARVQLSAELAASGASTEAVAQAKHLFDPNALTLGFARRFATYKRPNLLLHDRDRLLRLLSDPQRPVQLIMAGKAHPADQAGQALIQEWVRFIRRPEVRSHVIFLGDYDMLLAERLVQGVDVWINTPRRPWEASGTSGMKVLVNGGINLSELDGWWAEAYTPEVGWALGDGREHGDDPAWDAVEANALYDLLEREVVPQFYTREKSGIPTAWVARMRESMARLTPRFSTNRAVREYTEQRYLPAAAAYRSRAAKKGAGGRQIVDWQHALQRNWGKLHFGDLKVETKDGQHVFEVQVSLGDCGPDAVRVELFAEGAEGDHPMCLQMKRKNSTGKATAGDVYGGHVPATRPATDYTLRLVPSHIGAAVPLEAASILWQR